MLTFENDSMGYLATSFFFYLSIAPLINFINSKVLFFSSNTIRYVTVRSVIVFK